VKPQEELNSQPKEYEFLSPLQFIPGDYALNEKSCSECNSNVRSFGNSSEMVTKRKFVGSGGIACW
jgi:hypothetical protein